MKHIRFTLLSCLLIGVFLFSASSSKASHIMGADITYTCISPGQYSLQLKVFRDCNGIGLGTSINVNLFSPTCGNQTVNLTLVASHQSPGNGRPNGSNGVVITPTCPGQPDVCDNDPGAVYGIEEFIYKGTVNLTCQANDWVISWSNCCRNSAITTLNNPGGTGTYVSANLNTTLSPCNSSPDFLTRPTPFVCLNNVVNYSHGVSDPDNDSLVFSLVTCRGNGGANVNYSGSYSGTNPLTATGLSINSSSGALTFTPTAIQVGVLCIKVEEFRNGVKIGETVRDMQFRVINCPSNPPIVSGIDSSTTYQINVCANDNITFDLHSFDPDTAVGGTPTQNVTMTWNGGIQGANFTVNNNNPPSATFSWTPSNNFSGSNFFTVTVEDDACPLKAQNIFTYVINVDERPTVDVGPPQIRCGAADTVYLNANVGTPNTSVVPTSYQWVPDYNLSDATVQSPAAYPDSTTKYKVTVTYSNGCTEVDSLIVEYIGGIEIPPMNDTAICQGGVQLDATITSSSTTYTFSNDTAYPIPDNNPNGVSSSINVSGVSPAALATGSIASVCIDIEMVTPLPNSLSDLDVFLVSPGGAVLELTTGNGGFNGAAYDSTCFSMSASTLISSASTNAMGAYTGTYIPEDNFNTLNGTSSNGTWSLFVTDNNQFFEGQINSWSITFADPTVVNYSWSPTDSLSCTTCPNPIASPTQTTTYVVTANSTNGCVDVDSVTIFVANNLPAPVITCADVTPFYLTYCWDTLDGSIGYEVSLDGGATWIPPNNGTNCHTLSNLTPATSYTIDVRGISPCLNVTIGVGTQTCTTMPCTLASTLLSQSDETCSGFNDGSAVITATGGTPGVGGYTFTMAGQPPQQDTAFYNNLAANTYTVVVVDSFGCMDSTTFTINVPNPITLSTTSTDVTCFGAADGTATVTPSGGNGGFTFLWSNNDTTSMADSLMAGTYYVTVTDMNGCFAVDSTTIIEPAAITTTTSSTAVNCFLGTDGTATVTASGGTPGAGYLYNWSPSNQTGATATNLPAGWHYVTVTDANFCTAIDSVEVTQPATGMSTTTSTTPLNCNGDGSGTATVHAVGGSGTYSYAWSTVPQQTDSTATGLQAGSYMVTVTDVNGCSITNTVTVLEPPVLTATTTTTGASCAGYNDGTASAIPNGGVGGYTYAWNTSPVQTDSTATGLVAGTYTVTVTDANGCTTTASAVVTEPLGMVLTMSSNPTSCFGGNDGSAAVSVSGGSGNYTYLWNTNDTTVAITNLVAGNYIVTVTDVNGCSRTDSVQVTEPTQMFINTLKTDVSCFNGTDGSASATPSGGTAPYTYAWNTTPIQNTQTAINLPAGTYIVTVTDANNCSATASVTINQPPTGVSTSVTFTDVSCFAGNDGVATVNPTGGSGNYTYQWSNNQFTQTITGLIAGTYYVSVYDVNNCFVVDSAIIDQPAEITLIGGQTPSSCFGGNDGTATIAASGGTPTANGGYTYTWNTVPPQNTQTALFLTGGQTYSVTVTDVNGCFAVENITIGQPQKVQLTLSKQDISCNGFTDGSVTVSAIGGTPGYTYQWSANTGNDTLATSSNLGAGIYSVTVSDFNGCTASGSIAIEEPEPLAVLLQTENVLCKGESTGTINAFAAGGVPFYTLQWDARANNQSGVVAENLAAGTYAVTVTDANGCTIIDSATIAEPAEELTASMVSTDVSCFGERDGTVRIVAQGGRVPYEYSENGVNYTGTNVLVGLTADDYVVHVRDDNGCEFTDTVTITEPDEIIVDAGPDLYVEFDEEVPIVTSVTNGTIPYYFEWRPAEFLSCDNCPVPMASPPSDQEYLVVVTDANGCQGEDNVFVRVQKVRRIYVATGFSPNGDGINDALFVQGGDGTMRVVDFRVYDRWGELVFETADTPLNDPTMGWDGLFKGQKMNSGVYSWMITVEFSDGEQLNYQGNSTLVR